MATQKVEILKYVDNERQNGRTVADILKTLKVSKSSYYRWKKPIKKETKINSRKVTPKELLKIEQMKDSHPELRHRQIQGMLQLNGDFVSSSVIYNHLKSINKVEPYERRNAPWKEPLYEVYKANIMWGADWSQLRIGGKRWYLLTLIDFYSRYLIHFDVVRSVHSGNIKNLYQMGLLNFNIPLNWHLKPELRVDQGSPNTSRVTREFFQTIGAELSYASVRRPTENAITERFYRTIKQEEIYLVGDYQGEQTAIEEIGNYIQWYNTKRPHQSLWNFTPEMVHEINNKSELKQMLKQLKKKVWTERKQYWTNENN